MQKKTEGQAEWTKEERETFARGFAGLMDLWETTKTAWVEKTGSSDGHAEWFKEQLNKQAGRRSA